jgi:hypothetical protein
MICTRSALLFSLAVVTACNPPQGRHGGGDGGDPGKGPADMATGLPGGEFPSSPVIDATGNTPPDAPGMFGGTGDGSPAPCILDPQDRSLMPLNWLRPRFSFRPAKTGENLFEIRLHTDAETNDLVVYTTQNPWKLDSQYWTALQTHAADHPVTVSIRTAIYSGGKLTSGPSMPATTTFTVAPAKAPGAIVYWTAGRTLTALRGFSLGDEGVHDVMPTQSKPDSPPCLGCHTSTPDGSYVAFSWTSSADNGDNAQVRFVSSDGNVNPPPTSVVSTTTANTLLSRGYQQFPSFSQKLWDQGDRTMISMLSTDVGNTYRIYWTDLANGTSGPLPVSGDDGRYPGAASFSHSGTNVVYSSGTANRTGYQMTDGQLRVVPYNNRLGGASAALDGASNPAKNQFYPTYSDDDKFITFTRIDSTTESNLKSSSGGGIGNPLDEVYVIPAAGGTPTRLAANDPPSCATTPSPGLTNSWSKWAPESKVIGNRTFYWLTFSSKRQDPAATGNPAQLYVTPVVVGEDGSVSTYPALYLWNQPGTEGNHTPAWVNFSIPIS